MKDMSIVFDAIKEMIEETSNKKELTVEQINGIVSTLEIALKLRFGENILSVGIVDDSYLEITLHTNLHVEEIEKIAHNFINKITDKYEVKVNVNMEV